MTLFATFGCWIQDFCDDLFSGYPTIILNFWSKYFRAFPYKFTHTYNSISWFDKCLQITSQKFQSFKKKLKERERKKLKKDKWLTKQMKQKKDKKLSGNKLWGYAT